MCDVVQLGGATESVLGLRLARHAARGEWHHLEPRLGNGFSALTADAVPSRIDIGQGETSWVVMADPEGNEFCVLTPRES